VQEIQNGLRNSLYLTPPAQTLVIDSEITLASLYKAYVSVRPEGSSVQTKGRVLDGVVGSLRNSGLNVRRGDYYNDFLFDIVIAPNEERPQVAEVLSFATPAKEWAAVEHDAGHFLYAIEQAQLDGLTFIRPPSATSHENAVVSFHRVSRWMSEAGVRVLSPEDAKRGREVLS
jgi:hypothetical protein